MPILLATFAGIDWLVLAGYLGLLAASGWWLSRKPQTDAGDYFLAHRAIPTWAAAASLVATTLSAATFIGVPEFSYNRDLTYLLSFIGTIIAIFLVATLFVPIYFRHGVTTVYGVLELRLGPGAKSAASATFLIGRVLAEGARLYMASLAVSLVLFDDTAMGHQFIAVATLVVIGIFYTFMGGIRSVIFSDVLQLVVFVGAGIVAAIALLTMIPIDMAAIWQMIGPKLTVIRSGLSDTSPAGIELDNEFTLISSLSGLVLLYLAAYATDHDLAQRILTCRSAAAGSRSAIASVLMTIPVVLVFLIVGLFLWVFYQQAQAGAIDAKLPDKSREVFLSFILEQMPGGLKGAMIAGLLAAAISTVNSALNAMSAVFVTEFYRVWVPGRGERHYVAAGRWSVIGSGMAVGGFGAASIVWMSGGGQDLVKFALGVMTFAYSGLLAVFLTALFTRRGSSGSAVAAIIVGFVTVLLLEWQPWWDPADRMKVAFPYRMLIATGLSMAVCCIGRRAEVDSVKRVAEPVAS
jgi:SSS family transporter